MNSERWQRIKNVLYTALELPPGKRSAHLDAACADADFRREVESLLAANDQAGAFLEKAAVKSAGPAALIGTVVGHYRIVGEIGSGGMAAVYRAVREDDFQQEVAVKIIKRGMDTDELLERFRYERQILAWLRHNNIAQLLDGGAIADNRPYFVMELVTGRPVTDYCELNKLTVEERLRLFLKICGAVAYAHRNLVIHRDLKPANILIDEAGEPKLLDFGIAKVLLPDLVDERAPRTSAQLRLLTPEYASPEQVRGEQITTATDIYALGAVLYELLTGVKAQSFSASGPIELERVVCLTEPPKPSEVGPKQNRLRGDLDQIVLKSLEKQPERRYPHVEEFAADIERHLDGRPVLARPDTISYRLAKFCRRHKLYAAAAAAVLVTLISGVVAVSWQARIARRERNIAERRFDETRKLAWTLLFEIDPEIAPLAGATKVREKLLSRGIAFLDALSRDAKGDQALLRDLAEAYQNVAEVRGVNGVSNLGKHDQATENLRKAVALREQVLATDPRSVNFRVELSQTIRRLATQTTDAAEAERLGRRSLEIAEAAAREAPNDKNVRNALAGAHYQMGEQLRASQHQESMEHFRKAMELYDTAANVSLMHKKIAAVLALDHDFEHAADELKQAIALDEEAVRNDPTNARRKMDLTYGYTDLGNALQGLHQFPEAIEKFRMAESIRVAQATADPGDFRARTAVLSITWRISEVLAVSRDKPGAMRTMENAVKLADALNRDFPGNAAVRNQLLEVYARFGSLQAFLGSCPEAEKWWDLWEAKAAEWKIAIVVNKNRPCGAPHSALQ